MADEATAPAEQEAKPAVEVKNPEAVLRKNEELLEEVKRLKKDAKRYEGFDLDAAKAAMDAVARSEEEKLTKKGEFDKLLEQKQAAFDKRVAESEQRYNDLLDKLSYERKIGFYTSKGVRAEHADSIPQTYIQALELDPQDFSVKKVGGVGDAVELDELAATLKKSKPFLFEHNPASGSGASPSTNGGGGKIDSNLTPVQKLERIFESK